MQTKTNITIDFDINQQLRTDLLKDKQKGISTETKERTLGIMVEQQYELLKILKKKKLSFSDFLTTLKI
jgi:hypothetical protein